MYVKQNNHFPQFCFVLFFIFILNVYEKGHKNSPTLYKPVCTCNKS